MVRVRADWVRRQAGRELDEYLRQRVWHWTVKGNYALATDYAIRLLNRHPRDPLGLVLGEVAGTKAKQDVFANKCREAQRRLCFIKDVPTVVDLVGTGVAVSAGASTSRAPTREEVQVLVEDRLSEDGRGATPGRAPDGLGDEQIAIQDSAAAAEVQAAVRRSCLRASSAQAPAHPLAEVLEPRGSVYGRGLYATQRIAPRTPVLTDEPLLAQRSDESRCAHCLAPATSGNLVSCPHCPEESYCSQACQVAAWRAYHACCCRSVNPGFADWAAAMRETLYADPATEAPHGGGGAASEAAGALVDASSQARAALSCLAVAKACAMATVQQVHPLSLSGVASLRGVADYEPATALSEIGALTVSLSTTLRQPFLFMEEVLSLFALLQTNEFLLPGGVAVYPVLSLLNHSCDPNCTLLRATGHGQAQASDVRRTLVALRDIRDGEQLLIDYNAHLTSKLDYEQRKALCAQRHFECFCAKCVRRQ